MMSDFDHPAATLRGGPKALEALINLSLVEDRLWRNEDLAAIFLHQLGASLILDLGGFDPLASDRVKRLCAARDLPLKSFKDLFHHPAPPRELLVLTKNFAKANMVRTESPVPGEIATALYYLSIAAGMVHLGVRISKLSDSDMRRSLTWIKGRPWIDGETSKLLDEALALAVRKNQGGVP
jgi:hypothetical protein